jgi:hypothetical protein
MCKRIHNFGNLSSLQEILSLSRVITALERVYCSLSRVRGYYPDFRIPPNIGAHHGLA